MGGLRERDWADHPPTHPPTHPTQTLSEVMTEGLGGFTKVHMSGEGGGKDGLEILR